MVQHKTWIQAWLHPGIASGTGRQINDIKENVVDDLFDCEERNLEIMGTKIGVSK